MRRNAKVPGRPPAYWRRCNAQLAQAFLERCAYTAMMIGSRSSFHRFNSR
ncbi:hypothetical protein [Corallococcus sp. 4LFB]